MRVMSEKFPELDMLVTDVSYMRVEIRLTIPGESRTRTYCMQVDSRMMPVGPVRRPLDLGDHFKLIEWEDRLRKHRDAVQALATNIAMAIYDGEEAKS